MANPSHDKGNITDAEIAGFMGWRGPGAYTEASLRKIREIIEHVLRVERATPPSPSTAPEVRLPDLPVLPQSLMNEISDYGMARTDGKSDCERLELWKELIAGIRHYAAMYGNEVLHLASRPAEVDDGRLPELPLESARASKGKGQFYMKWSETGKDLRGELLLFTAEQYRQGQRDAVAADRARRGDRS